MITEVMLRGASIWTFEGGKVKGAAFYADQDEARKAAGLGDLA